MKLKIAYLKMTLILIILALTSCAKLESIPISFSYQDDQGETFTITKGAVIRPTK